MMLESLRAELGAAVLSDGVTLEAARADKSGQRSASAPLAVVEAKDVSEVQETLRWAYKHGVGVVPRGAGSGLAGGALASAGEIVLSTVRMNRILQIAAEDQYAVVEAGVVLDDLAAALAPHGLWYAPDPASRALATIGGTIATGAGGLMCVKYGVTREAVLGLTVVLADGRLIELGHRSVKGVTGYDLTALMIGSEGTLGVVTTATLRLRPQIRGRRFTVSATFAEVSRAAGACVAITASGVIPAVMELLDSSSLELIGKYLGEDLSGRGAQLLIRTDGAGAEAEAKEIAEIITSNGGSPEYAADGIESERLFAIRRAFHPAMEAVGSVLIEDIAVPRSALAQMFSQISRIENKYGIAIPTVAHAGDGNLHPNFIFSASGGEPPEYVWDAADELFHECLRLGGTLTGEHGVGLLKRRWLGEELGEDSVQLQRAIKTVFDPAGILNPGKLFWP